MVKKTSRRTSRKSSCPPGKIERASYMRKSKSRKGSTYVPKSCVPAKGKAIKRGSKTPEKEKVLPKIKKDIKLRAYGYSINKSEDMRRAALRAAIKENGKKAVTLHLNLIRNYQPDVKAKRIMSQDVEYLKNM